MAAAASVGGGAAGVAPFVWKTYRMVEDPGTNGVIGWGRANNTFVVADPFVFSQTLLPTHFKHNNFSSFVRQLNTYGFRKVDPDRWEFAHGSFLRGQTHLLRNIVRRGTAVGGGGKRKDPAAAGAGLTDDDMTMVATEVVRLKKEQSTIDDRVGAMWRRVQETERRPKQMLAFLLTVVGDRDMLQRLVAGGDGDGDGDEGADADGLDCDGQEQILGGEKRPRLLGDGEFGDVTAFGPDAVDFAGFYGGGDAFANVAVEAAAGSGVGGAVGSFGFGLGHGY
ncbi:heat stress transcription factor C-2b-like [Lolium rigidum]|uniref:heat stress transcription factor C-2b-like n=1 Tax=Lolium rigidum TaxID=89674 RepID=UPI001F5E2134|nr:heat stress transcription factor C-2b-like [Lolium rigidum]XP_047074043.1 heat stress transcription factor C-2b-like [Lolium rigidum]